MAKPTAADFTRAHNAACYALGAPTKTGRFHVRRVVWGRLLARAERRPGEEMRKASLSVALEKSH